MKEKTHEDFLNKMLVNLNNMEDTSPNSFSYDILSSASIVFQDIQLDILELRDMFNVENLEDEDLDKRVFDIAAVVRKQATKATGEVLVTGDVGVHIPKDSIFLAGETEFVCLDDYTIPDGGVVVVKVECTVAGVDGDVIPKSINKLKDSIEGVVDIYNPNEFVNGYEAETDDDLRERYYDKLMNPPQSGNPAHYKLWATEVDGIGNAKVFRTWNGPSTVKVIVLGIDRKAVDGEMVQRVKEHIMQEAPLRYENLTVESAVEKSIEISFKLSILNGYDFEDIKDAIKTEIETYLYSIAFKQDFVSYAKIGGAILSVDGVSDYSNLKINNGTSNVILLENEVAELGVLEVILNE